MNDCPRVFPFLVGPRFGPLFLEDLFRQLVNNPLLQVFYPLSNQITFPFQFNPEVFKVGFLYRFYYVADEVHS